MLNDKMKMRYRKNNRRIQRVIVSILTMCLLFNYADMCFAAAERGTRIMFCIGNVEKDASEVSGMRSKDQDIGNPANIKGEGYQYELFSGNVPDGVPNIEKMMGNGNRYNLRSLAFASDAVKGTYQFTDTHGEVNYMHASELHYDPNGGTGAPENQIISGTATLSSVIPERSGYEFLGWADVKTAGLSDNWYDPGDDYFAEGNSTLYAQWYDISSLENEYAKYIHGDDLVTEKVNMPKLSINGWYAQAIKINTPENVVALSGFDADSDYVNIYIVISNATKSQLYARGEKKSGNTVKADPVMEFLCCNHTDQVSHTGDIDSRINKLSEISSVCVRNTDFMHKSFEKDYSIAASSGVDINMENSVEGYRPVMVAGWNTGDSSEILTSQMTQIGSNGSVRLSNTKASAMSSKINVTYLYLKERSAEESSEQFEAFDTVAKTRFSKLTELDELSNYLITKDNLVQLGYSTKSGFTASGSAYDTERWDVDVSSDKRNRVLGAFGTAIRNGGGSDCSMAMLRNVRLSDYDSQKCELSISANGMYRRETKSFCKTDNCGTEATVLVLKY